MTYARSSAGESLRRGGRQGAAGAGEPRPGAQRQSDWTPGRRPIRKQLARFLEGEQPQTIAIILAYLDSKPASALLMKLPEQVRVESVKRLACCATFLLRWRRRFPLVLHKRLQSLGEQSRRTYAGFKSAADLMNRLEPEYDEGGAGGD